MNIKDLPQGSYKIIQPPTGLLNAAAVGAKPPVIHQSIEKLKADQVAAEKEAGKSITSRFFHALPGAILDTGVGGIAQFGASALNAPHDIITGQSSGKSYKIPGLTPFKTLQGEAQQQVQEGASPLKAIINKGTKTILEGAQTAGAAKYLLGDINLATGQATQGLIPRKLGELSDNKIWKLVQPKLTGKELQAANKAGELQKTGLLRTVKPTTDQELINVAKPYLKTSDPIKGATQINRGIEQEASRLIQGVGDRGGTWSISNLKGALNDTKIPIGVRGVSDAQIGGVKDYVSTLAKDAPKNAGGALSVAKQFRSTINNEFGENIWTKDTPIAQYVRSINRSLNNFAAGLLPDGTLTDGTSFFDSMRRQTKLFEALDNIVAKTPKIGTSAIKSTAQTVGKVVKVGAEIVGGGYIAKKLGIFH